MRDRDKWRERVEISLDNSQILLLFFAVSVVLSLVFALGVVVGKRVGPRVADQPHTDPLALLDQLSQEQQLEPGSDLTFARALTTAVPAAEPDAGAADTGAAKQGKGLRTAGSASADQTQYTLQLSSFQDRLEAEQFVAKLRKVGLETRIVPAQIPGRGLWFRVRLGSFASWEEAVAAKERFERDHSMIAYVARP